MVTASKIDIDHLPDVERLAREVRESGTARILRRGGEDIAVLSPLPARRKPRRRANKESARAAVLAVAGGWSGLVDGDELIRKICADREIAERPPVEM